ncbi:MAG TPA: peptidoglycan editing factor PgeF [Bacillota bacterium]|nr:peptidoglycan editing factor PgeF [Bacillota bacterium]
MKEDFILKTGMFPYYISPLLEKNRVMHLFTTRHGGISKGCFESLNFAIGQGSEQDSSENVSYHHSLASKQLGLTEDHIVRAWQLHTSVVERADASNCGVPYNRGVDGLVSNTEDIILSVRTADCVPILLYDKNNGTCGAVHAGWRGTKDEIIVKAVKKMMSDFGSSAENIIAAIGPCARECCYEVQPDFKSNFGSRYSDCFTSREDKLFFSTAEANIIQLLDAGIPDENISDCGICTCCSDEFYSHRRQGINRGSLAAFIRTAKF